MVVISENISATTAHYPINIPKNASNSYIINVSSEAYNGAYSFSATDAGNKTQYLLLSIDYSDLLDGEYQYSITDSANTIYGKGLLQLGEPDGVFVQYDNPLSWYEYDPISGNSEIVGGYNLVDVSTAITTNGQIEIDTPEGAYGISKVIANVNVEGSGRTGTDKLKTLVDGSISAVTAEDLSGITKLKNYAFSNCYDLESIELPNTISAISSYAFAGCYSLSGITIPDSVTKIGNYSFSYCSGLTSITIPDSVTTIGEYAFLYCSSLTDIDIPDSITNISYAAFTDCFSLTGVTIPDSVTGISNQAFQVCSALTSITIPDSVTTIGNSAFRWCLSLSSITLSNNLTTMGTGCLGNTALKEIRFPDSLAVIPNQVANNCSALTDIYIGSATTSIGSNAFTNDPALTNIYSYSIAPPVITSVSLPATSQGYTIYVPAESVDSYKISWHWYSDRIQAMEQ